MTSRPLRTRITDSLGRLRTLADGPDAYETLNVQAKAAADPLQPLLFLGIGAHPEDALHLVPEPDAGHRPVFWLESPAFLEALRDAGVSPAVPATWRRLDPADAGASLSALIRAHHPLILAYRQARRLFPEFWGPLLAACRLENDVRESRREENGAFAENRPAVLLPGGADALLHRELEQALSQEGLRPLPFATEDSRAHNAPPDLTGLLALLKHTRPAFLLSVNLRGLDPEGNTFHLLRAAGVPVCIWFVDNPWQILSSLRLPWWKDAILLTTDATFLPGLRACGARCAEFLPLAASSFFLTPRPAQLPRGIRVLFVGRTSFPDKHAFFSAAPRHPAWEAEAGDLLRAGERPDYHWWIRRLETDRGESILSWPGHAAREAGRGTEELALSNRLMWLEEAAALGRDDAPALEVIGDAGWRKCLSAPARILPPVDYYDVLPGLYRAAPFTLDVTSLLLPGGLTQRHFDVWQAGGFLLTATGTGLDIFPPEIAAPIALRRPGDLVRRVKDLDHSPAYKETLREAWQKEIGQKHLYRHRIQSILDLLKKLDWSLSQV